MSSSHQQDLPATTLFCRCLSLGCFTDGTSLYFVSSILFPTGTSAIGSVSSLFGVPNIWLTKTQPIHIARWGTFVQPEVRNGHVELRVSVEVSNETAAPDRCAALHHAYC